MPRKSKLSLEKLSEIIKKYEDILFPNSSSVMTIGPSHNVWSRISDETENKISGKSVYTMLKCDRNNMLELIGKPATFFDGTIPKDNTNLLDLDFEDENPKPSANSVLKFELHLTQEEWNSIKVQDIKYLEKRSYTDKLGKMYKILKPGVWTSLIHEKFWKATKIPCAITYKRAKVYQLGTRYCIFTGVCRNCNGQVRGEMTNKPTKDQQNIKFECVFKGNYMPCNQLTRKRKLLSFQKENLCHELITHKMSSDVIRRMYANEIMEEGDREPAHLPTANALRVAKSKTLKRGRIDDDPILSICKMKYLEPYHNVLRDIGYDRFFLHYWSLMEINVYREYTKRNEISTISIDATGSLVKKPILLGKRKTKHILLYEIAVHDKKIRSQYSVGHMLSERHDTNSIAHWLVEWLRSGAPCPKQVVTDMSIALMSAVTKSFTQYNSLVDYISACYNFLMHDVPTENEKPSCFIRCDVAHVIKLMSTWKPFQRVDGRVKDFIMRSMTQIILSDDIDDIKILLKSLFSVVFSKTVGYKSVCGESRDIREDTYAEERRQFLVRRIATGLVEEYMNQIQNARSSDDMLDTDLSDEVDNDLEENNASNNENFIRVNNEAIGISITERSRCNLFYMMAYEMATISKEQVDMETGSHENLHYLPEIVPNILDLCFYLPLWSGVMCKKFSYGDIPPTSASIESQFSDLKNRVLKHCDLPLRIDEFIEIHVKSLNGTMKLVSSKQIRPTESVEPHLLIEKERTLPERTDDFDCVCCIRGDLPSGAHKCIICQKSVHLLKGCSYAIGDEEGYGEQRICKNCASDKHNSQSHVLENLAMENWRNINRKSPGKKPSVYLTPRPELLHRNINSKAKTTIIGLIRNGMEERLKTIRLKNGNFILTNTCAFDSIVQAFAVAYCDSENYAKFVQDNTKSTFWNLIWKLLQDGVTVQAYRKRAKILSSIHTGEKLPNDVTLLSVEQPVDSLIPNLLKEYPSISLKINCSACHYEKMESITHLNICVNKNLISNFELHELMQNALVDSTQDKILVCNTCSRLRKRSKIQQRVAIETNLRNHLLFNIVKVTENMQGEGLDLQIILDNIPKVIRFSNKELYLRAAITTPDSQKFCENHTTIGHYHSHCYRQMTDIWELYDDTRNRIANIKNKTAVNVQVLLYSI